MSDRCTVAAVRLSNSIYLILVVASIIFFFFYEYLNPQILKKKREFCAELSEWQTFTKWGKILSEAFCSVQLFV